MMMRPIARAATARIVAAAFIRPFTTSFTHQLPVSSALSTILSASSRSFHSTNYDSSRISLDQPRPPILFEFTNYRSNTNHFNNVATMVDKQNQMELLQQSFPRLFPTEIITNNRRVEIQCEEDSFHNAAINMEEQMDGGKAQDEDTLYLDSVKRKRVKKMNKHKYKKRLKAERNKSRKTQAV